MKKTTVNFCPNCGNQIKTNAIFCNKCGYKLNEVLQKNTFKDFEDQASRISNQKNKPNSSNQKMNYLPPNQQYPPQSYSSPVQYPSNPSVGYDSRKSSNKILAAVIAIAVIIVIILALLFFVFSEEELTGKDKAKSVVEEYINSYEAQNWEKMFSMEMYSNGSFYSQEHINYRVNDMEEYEDQYMVSIEEFEILGAKKLNYNAKYTLEIYSVNFKLKMKRTNTETGKKDTQDHSNLTFYVAKNKNGKWGISSSGFYSDEEEEEEYYVDSTPILQISQVESVDVSEGYWVNFTVYSASADAKWDELNIFINGINYGSPINTYYPNSGQCGHDSGGYSISAGDMLYCHSNTLIESGDMIQVLHTTSNSIILQKTIT